MPRRPEPGAADGDRPAAPSSTRGPRPGAGSSDAAAPDGAGPGPEATGPARETELAAECEVFARHLAGEPPSRYAVERYVAAHRARPGDLAPPDGPFQRLVVRLARRGSGWAWLLDCHERVWAPDGALRTKLVLLVAILECSPPSSRRFRPDGPESAARVLARLAGRAAAFAAGVLVSTVLLLPVKGTLRAVEAVGAGREGPGPGTPEPRDGGAGEDDAPSVPGGRDA